VTDYAIRPFEAGDAGAFLSLYETVFGAERSEEWFAWKYERNPYVDHVPILLATDGESVVGARSFFALGVARDGDAVTALQPCDAMVHPDHRRRGLFTRMTERAIERYSGTYPFMFNFPNEASLPGNLKLGWEVVAERETYYRIENPGAVAAAETDRASAAVAGRLAAPIAGLYYRVFGDGPAPSPAVSVRRVEGVASAELAALYRRAVPEERHAVRDERFYEWRFDNPDWAYTTYVAEADGGPEAAVLVGRSTGPEPTKVMLTDVVPLRDPPERALVALVDRVLDDYSGADMFCAPPQVLPERVLDAFGFRSDATYPLSAVTDAATHVARSLGERGGPGLTDPDEWLLTFAELDGT
jgi:GNAT superfamily N-acetyltransferase